MYVFLTYISLKIKGVLHRCNKLQVSYKRWWKLSPSASKQCRALDNILANSIDCLLGVSFGETFLILHQWVYRVKIFLEIHDFFSVALIDGMIPILHAFLDDNGHFTSMNGDRYLSLLQKKMFDRSCGTLRHVLFCGGCKMALRPI